MFETLFRKRDLGSPNELPKHHLKVDVHSHILPNLDDGAESIEQSLALVKGLHAQGFEKIIATPHVMSGYYNNSSEKILEATLLLKSILKRQKINIEIEAAAEYYLEDSLFELIEQKNILSFGEGVKYLLFETSFVGKATYLLESALKIKYAGYTPVLAHPERYTYLDISTLQRLASHGVLFQLNLNSLTGYYSRHAQELAEQMISRNMVSFVGSDCHNLSQIETLKLVYDLPYFQMVMKQNLLNDSLFGNKKLQEA